MLSGSRGAAAGALGLHYHVDDNVKNCLDVIAESRAKPILIVPDGDEITSDRARELGMGTARSLTACLDILDRAAQARTEPGRLARLAAMVGWK